MESACPKCGYHLTPFDKECPRCARWATAVCSVCGGIGVAAACDRCHKEICHACARRSAGTALCPRCATSTTLGEEPVQVAPGGEVAGSADWFKRLFDVIRSDPAWGVLLGLLFLDVVVAFVHLNILSLILDALILWGVFTLQRWAYYVAMVLTSLRILLLIALAVIALLAVGRTSESITAAALAFLLIPLAISFFTLVVLSRRRQYFS